MATTSALLVRGICRWCGVPRRLDAEPDAAGQIAVTFFRRAGERGLVVLSTPIRDAVPYLAWCVEHRQPLQAGKHLRATRSAEPCSVDCRTATGNVCRCSCAGLNHGADA